MSLRRFFFYWSVLTILALIALIVVFIATSTAAQALDGSQSIVFQNTPPALTVVVPTVVVTNLPPVTIVPPTAVIPNTGGDTIFVDFSRTG